MRKDVKLAFAVGGILISVLIVYVMVVPGGDKRSDRQPVSLEEKSQQTVTTQTPVSPAVTDKTTDAPKATEVASDQKPADAAAPTTKPTDPFASASDKTNDKDKEDTWMLALNRGSVPMMTSAPPVGTPAMARTSAARSQGSPTSPLAGTSVAVEQTSPSTRPVASDAATPTAGMRTHVVAKGETIAKISEAVYGSQNYWPHILRANPGLVAEKIRPGMTINLPPESDVKTTASNTTTVADPTAPKPDTTSPKLDAQTQYEVQSGDSLAKIAMKLYGNSNKWQAIYDLNKEAIGDNPAKLKQKSILKLPEPPTQK